jgi:hypothetical protein
LAGINTDAARDVYTLRLWQLTALLLGVGFGGLVSASQFAD